MFNEPHCLYKNIFSIACVTWDHIPISSKYSIPCTVAPFMSLLVCNAILNGLFEIASFEATEFFCQWVQGTNVAVKECFFLESPTIRFIAENKAYAWSMGSRSELKSITSPLEDVVVTTRIVGMRTSMSGSLLLCMNAHAFLF